MLRLISAFCLVMLMSVPAHAQSRKELAAQDAIIIDRLSRLESRMLTGDPAAERLMQRMDALEGEMRTLTGDVERLRFERDQLRTDVAGLAAQLEGLQALASRTQTHLDAVDLIAQEQSRRPFQNQPSGQNFGSGQSFGSVDTLQGGTGMQPNFPSEGTFDPNQPNAVSPPPTFGERTIGVQQFNVDTLPETGKQKLAEGDFSGAQIAFRQYLDINPDAADAGDVNYWLGESYFVRGGYADAADAYITSMRKAPQGDFAPNAMVGLAATMRQLGNKDEACAALDSFPTQYPNASLDVQNKANLEMARTGC
ncbi:tetratricopeptide repeat protein [Fretibacter rubidus]|uniref:tetratricopeptide repeat protein n=1 Tax=Fretibacter rubidus TaxID=570162 RepID=UPI00352AE88B